jgi:hypothetical protein
VRRLARARLRALVGEEALRAADDSSDEDVDPLDDSDDDDAGDGGGAAREPSEVGEALPSCVRFDSR